MPLSETAAGGVRVRAYYTEGNVWKGALEGRGPTRQPRQLVTGCRGKIICSGSQASLVYLVARFRELRLNVVSHDHILFGNSIHLSVLREKQRRNEDQCKK